MYYFIIYALLVLRVTALDACFDAAFVTALDTGLATLLDVGVLDTGLATLLDVGVLDTGLATLLGVGALDVAFFVTAFDAGLGVGALDVAFFVTAFDAALGVGAFDAGLATVSSVWSHFRKGYTSEIGI